MVREQTPNCFLKVVRKSCSVVQIREVAGCGEGGRGSERASERASEGGREGGLSRHRQYVLMTHLP